ncbi:hypothetical protein GCM10023115_15630 [Pontixanthobacter gangjinensis]|uniref:Capsule synthesis protein CapA domain-containing protein n=1 Tax=Pontixanthobacter gangjinensis TaxID=1028742 RepID=A0A6I4SP03_9SPHN|nr:CapA family protein [Pontixanthobacter gangjinensis]MXO56806.1 hypothetical protein [Pontixanthobacter gangjinensis]
MAGYLLQKCSFAIGIAALFIAVPTFAQAGFAAQPAKIDIFGALDGSRDQIKYLSDDLTVSINGIDAALNADGSFKASIPAASYYRIDIGGGDVFAMVQSFGVQETYSAQCGCLKIPVIELVRRTKGRVELFFGGDTMAGRRYIDPARGERQLIGPATAADDLDRLLAPMRPYIESADLASVNLETVLADNVPGEASPKRIVFYSPTALAGALTRAGVDYVTLGNNHINDYNDAGIRSTHAALDAAGLARSGSGYLDREAEAPHKVMVAGEKVAMLGFVGWQGDWTPNQAAGETKGGAAFGTRGQIRRSVRAAARSGYIPILQYHGGSEYSDRPGTTTSSRLREAIDQGAPLAIGHHPHVVQGLEVHNGGLIAWSIGNFMFDQDFLETHSSFVLKVWLEDGAFLRAEVVPIAVVDYRPIPAVGRMREATLRRVFSLSSEAGTRFAMSGGHAVIRADGQGDNIRCDTGHESFKLDGFGGLCHAAKGVRVGRDLLRRGDFETAIFRDAVDRAWGARNAAIGFYDKPEGGRYLTLTAERTGRPMYLYPQSYVRDASQADYVIEVMVRAPDGVRVDFLAKDRPPRGTRATARWRGDNLGTVMVMPAQGWQKVSLPFSREVNEDGTITDFRPAIGIRQLQGTAVPLAKIELDDFALVELQPSSDPQSASLPDWRWTHVYSQPGLTR